MKLLAIAAVAVAAFQAAAQPETDENDDIWLVVLKNGTELMARLKSDEGAYLNYELVEPGKEGKPEKVFKKNIDRTVPLSRLDIEEQLRKRWEKLGYTQVGQDRDGNPVWRLATEVEIARQAKEMALTLEQQDSPEEAEPPDTVQPEPVEPEERRSSPSIVALWGPEVALAAAALVLIAVIAKTLILGGSE